MKSFSELTSASQVNNGDLLAISQTSGSGYASKKTTVKDITDKSNLNLAEEYDSTSTYAVDDYVIYESVLYKCIGTTTGTFDSTKWTSVVVTDEMGSGGGGGTGGHTIIDENGNSMTARAGLQFFGAVEVTDDSANNRTLVEVLGGDFYNPVIYSTEEREIGVWTDGKPLYEKTVDVGQYNVTLVNNVWNNVFALLNVDYLAQAIIHKNSPNTNHGLRFQANNGYIQGSASQQVTLTSLGTFYITFQYTKSTDVAGSGSWTPQGVPTYHYSTDEQIVGTWIDGSTLYEKTIDYTVNKSASHTFNFAYGNVKRMVDGFIINSLNSICFPVNCSWESKTEEFLYDETHFYINTSANIGNSSTLRIIVQYTKSS